MSDVEEYSPGNEPAVYPDATGHIIYRASTLGRCVKSLALARAGFTPTPPPPRLQTIFTAGHAAEEMAAIVMEQDGYTITRRQDAVELSWGGKYVVRAHLDGILWRDDWARYRIWECKSQVADPYQRWTPDSWTKDPLWAKYAWQVSVEMLALDMELLLTRFERVGDTGLMPRVAHTVIEQPFHSFGEIIARVMGVEAMAAAGEMAIRAMDCEESYGCPYAYMHKNEKDKDKPALVLFDDDEFAGLVRDYAESQEDVRKTNAWMKDAKARIIAWMADKGVEAAGLGDGITVEVKVIAIKAHEVRAGSSTRVTVKVPSGDERTENE